MRKTLAVLCAALCMLAPGLAGAQEQVQETGAELLYNGDFAVYTDSARLPSGWTYEAYVDEGTTVMMAEDAEYGMALSIDSADRNDARVYQDVAVAPDAVYLLSGMVRVTDVSGGTGASLSIDNYAIDGTYCYSENLHGSEAWQPVEMYVQTGPEQTSLRVAMRLGGYGTMAAGHAEFAALSLVRSAQPEGAAVIDLLTENGTIENVGDSSGTILPETATGVFLRILLCALACAALYAFLYMRLLRDEGGMLPKMEWVPARILAGMLAVAFLLRLVLSLVFFGHSTDITCFMAWGNAALNGGLSNFYTSGMFADYPPGYMYICGFLAWICKLFGIPYGSDTMAFLFKLPATAADLFSAYLVYRIAGKRGCTEAFSLILAGLVAFNPVLMYISGAWGQIDTLLTLLLVLALYCFIGGKRILAGAVYGLAILMKPQALMLGPVLAAAYIAGCFGPDWKRALRDAVLAVLAALAVLFFGALPFQGTQTGLWLVDKYVATAGGYPYASVEAFNLFSLFGGNWAPVDGAFLGLTYRIWGTVGIVLTVAFAITAYVLGRKRSEGALYLAGAVLIAGVFTLGHFMHERYLIPALLLLLMAYLYYRDRRLLLAFGALTVPALINALAAMYIVDHQNARTAMYRAVTVCGSLLSVLAFALLCCLAVSILICGRTYAAAPTRAHKRADTWTKTTVYTLPTVPTETKLRYTKRDIIYVLSVTLVYGIVALTNLGATDAPETFWRSTHAGDTVVVDFGGERYVSAFAIYGNIDKDGTLLVTSDAYETTYTQTYDDMFRWKRIDADFAARTVQLMTYSGTLKLNEIAFYDENGDVLPVTVLDAPADAAALFDEQDTVPAIPSYYNGMYFDELYHGRTAYEHLHNLAPYENSHPPLGKLIIMIGVALFGMCPFGWRVMGALFGIGMLPILYAFGKRIFKNSEYALLATVLFAFDFMHFTQTRIATIDVYAVFFILLMYYYMYQYIRMNFFADGLRKTYKPLFLAGLFFGIGTACKWTCVYAGGGLAVLLLLSLSARYREYARLSEHGTQEERERVAPYWRYVVNTLLMCCLFYIAIPVVIYFASYTPYFIYEAGNSDGSYGLSGMVKTFARYQEFMYSYHSGLDATHPYQSAWYQWPFTAKPMWYYFNSYSAGAFVSTLTASGNPAVWWVCSIGAIGLFVERLIRRVRPDCALQVICVGVLANYLPWVLVSRCTFIYHFFATVPFLILATVYLLQTAEAREPRCRYVKWVWIGLALLCFILLYPGLSGFPVSNEWAAVLHKLPGGELMYGAG